MVKKKNEEIGIRSPFWLMDSEIEFKEEFKNWSKRFEALAIRLENASDKILKFIESQNEAEKLRDRILLKLLPSEKLKEVIDEARNDNRGTS